MRYNLVWYWVAAWLWLGGCQLGLTAASNAVVRASTPYIITPFDSEDGLPQNTVTAVTQTRDGYLWLGTLGGLVRFDGIRFTIYDEVNTPGLNSSAIASLFEDTQGNLWVGTETAGVVLVRDGQASTVGSGHTTHEGRLTAACEDAAGAVWLYTADGQLWRYYSGHASPFLFELGGPSPCRVLMAERGGLVWIGTGTRQSAIGTVQEHGSLELPVEQNFPVSNRLDYLLGSARGGYWRLADGRVQKCRTNSIERDFGPYPWDRDRQRVTAACEDREGNLLVGVLGAGVYWYNAEGKATCLSTNEGLSHNNVLSLCVDREDTLWVGTDGGGLNRVKRPVFEVLDVSRSSADRAVQSVCEDEQGGLWIGVNNGGVVHWQGGDLERFIPAWGVQDPYVWAVLVDQSHRIWAGTWGGGGLFQKQNQQFRPVAGPDALRRGVHALFQDRRGRVWVGTQGGLSCWDEREWKVFTTREGLSSDEVQALAEDAEGNLWIGTVGGGLNRLKQGRFSVFHKHDGLPSEDVSALCVDAEGILWIGTSGSGLARLGPEGWTRYTTSEGLVRNGITYLLADGQGWLWLGSSAGLMRVPRSALNDVAAHRASFVPCRAYGKADGLPTRECTQGSQPGAMRTREGKLWFSTIRGLVSVNPAQLKPNLSPPPVVIESVLIDGQGSANGLRVKPLSSVTLAAGKEHLEINYTSLNLAAPDRALFKHRLEQHESQWVEAGNIRQASYSRLPPGHYRFVVTACNEDGVWNPAGCALEVTVVPAFWRTWWFQSACAVGFLGLIVAVVHYLSTQRLQRQLEQHRQREALERERQRIARDIHDQLGASLTQVALLGELVESDKEDPEEVGSHARQISQTARDTTRVLDEIVWTVNPSNDTLEGLINYVCKYAQEYLEVAAVRYRLEVPAQLPSVPLLPEVRHNVFLAAKEAVTNVVRHAKASEVHLRLHLSPGAFTLEIQDNGRGVGGLDEKAARSRNGLRNMFKRMEDIGGTFSLGPAPGGGALVRLSVPLAEG